jgi:nucleoside 2-deoxyribosyltransferase
MTNLECDRDTCEKVSHLAAERHIHNKNGFIICEQDNRTFEICGEQLPCFTIETFLKNYPKDSIEILDRTLLNLVQLEKFPGSVIELTSVQNDEALEDITRSPQRAIAFTNSWNKLVDVLILLHNEELVTLRLTLISLRPRTPHTSINEQPSIKTMESYFKNHDEITLRVPFQGLQRIRELQKKQVTESRQVFVAMWFDESRDEFFPSMRQAVIDAGFEKCVRIDNKEHNNKICDEIIAEIRKSCFVIADFTENRGGVYFEAGFALGLGLPVIWIVDDIDKDNLHFDTRQYAHIIYKNKDDLYKKLKARIEATIPVVK